VDYAEPPGTFQGVDTSTQALAGLERELRQRRVLSGLAEEKKEANEDVDLLMRRVQELGNQIRAEAVLRNKVNVLQSIEKLENLVRSISPVAFSHQYIDQLKQAAVFIPDRGRMSPAPLFPGNGTQVSRSPPTSYY
jgi:hypothetical protein